MSLAKFAPPTGVEGPAPNTLSRSQAASRLGIAMGAIDKLVAAHIFELPICAELVERLQQRSYLTVLEGEATVLRTDACKPAHPGDDRPEIGFSTKHSDTKLEQTSLRWWRSNPARVLDNELLTVTVATIPVAVYQIDGVEGEKRYPGESRSRFHYTGSLLHRVHPGVLDLPLSPGVPARYRDQVRQIMSSRIKVVSGGPIGYLGANPSNDTDAPIEGEDR